MKKMNSTVERGLITICLVWGFYSISRPIFEGAMFEFSSMHHWLLFSLYVLVFVGAVFLCVEIGLWVYRNNEQAGALIKGTLVIVGGLLAAGFVVAWDKIVVPHFVALIGA